MIWGGVAHDLLSCFLFDNHGGCDHDCGDQYHHYPIMLMIVATIPMSMVSILIRIVRAIVSFVIMNILMESVRMLRVMTMIILLYAGMQS